MAQQANTEMAGLIDAHGRFRNGGVGIYRVEAPLSLQRQGRLLRRGSPRCGHWQVL